MRKLYLPVVISRQKIEETLSTGSFKQQKIEETWSAGCFKQTALHVSKKKRVWIGRIRDKGPNTYIYLYRFWMFLSYFPLNMYFQSWWRKRRLCPIGWWNQMKLNPKLTNNLRALLILFLVSLSSLIEVRGFFKIKCPGLNSELVLIVVPKYNEIQ